MSKKEIEDFLEQMREQHLEEIEDVELPEGTESYIAECMAEGDVETFLFMLKLSYLMGLHAGIAAQQIDDEDASAPSGQSPLKA